MEEYIKLFLTQLVIAAAGGVSTYFGMKLRAKQAELEAKEADAKLRRKIDRVVLRITIRQACKKHIKNGWVPLDDKGDILDGYESYEEAIAMDGLTNGVIDDCIKQLRALPNTPPLKEVQQ